MMQRKPNDGEPVRLLVPKDLRGRPFIRHDLIDPINITKHPGEILWTAVDKWLNVVGFTADGKYGATLWPTEFERLSPLEQLACAAQDEGK